MAKLLLSLDKKIFKKLASGLRKLVITWLCLCLATAGMACMQHAQASVTHPSVMTTCHEFSRSATDSSRYNQHWPNAPTDLHHHCVLSCSLLNTAARLQQDAPASFRLMARPDTDLYVPAPQQAWLDDLERPPQALI